MNEGLGAFVKLSTLQRWKVICFVNAKPSITLSLRWSVFHLSHGQFQF